MLCGTHQSSPCEEVEDNSALAVGETGLASESNESTTDQEPRAQEPETRVPEVEELATEPAQEEECTQSEADAREEAAPEAGGPAPQAKEFYFDLSVIDVIGAQGSLDEPQNVSEIETSTSHEGAFILMENTQDDDGNDEKLADQGTKNAVVLDLQSESTQSTIFQCESDSTLIDLALDSGISTEPARTHSLPEPEVFDFPCIIPKASSKSEAEIKAEKKKAEHRRYKAKKKAEAAAKRRLKEEEEELAEVVEALEPPKTLAQIQAEEDTKLGDKRLQQQAKRQEQQDQAASLRGLIRSSRAHLIY